MSRVGFALRVVAVLAFSLGSAPWVHAQATVETGGATGATTKVTTIAPDFTGMSSTLTSTAANTTEPTGPQASDPAQMTAPDPEAEPPAPASDEVPDQPETSEGE